MTVINHVIVLLCYRITVMPEFYIHYLSSLRFIMIASANYSDFYNYYYHDYGIILSCSQNVANYSVVMWYIPLAR